MKKGSEGAEKKRDEDRLRFAPLERTAKNGWGGKGGRRGRTRGIGGAAERVVHVAWSQHRFPS